MGYPTITAIYEKSIKKMRSKQYQGSLNPKTAAEGIKFAYENALSLLNDAELLFNHGRYERCVSLSILAIEESGKSTIIRSLLLSDDNTHLKKEWKNYRKHTEKNLSWILPDLITNGAKTLDDLKRIFDTSSDHGQSLENLKQLSIYTDIFSSTKWSTPSKVIDKEIALMIFSTAQSIVKIDRILTTEGELELWIKHLKPVQSLGSDKMKNALKNCYVEAASIGLIDEWKIEELTRFLK